MIVHAGTQAQTVKALVRNGTVVVTTEERAKKVVKDAVRFSIVAGYKPWKRWYAVFVKKRLG